MNAELFGTPTPLQAEANLGVMKADHVNIIVHGHEPLLSEMIVAASQSQEMIDLAKQVGAKGIPAQRYLLYRQRTVTASRYPAGRDLPAAGTGDHHRRL